MNKILGIILLSGIIYADFIKYDCGVVGEFTASVPLKSLLFTLYVDEKKSMTVYDGYNNKMSNADYYETFRAKEITEDAIDLSKQLPNTEFSRFKKYIASDNIIFDKYVDVNTGNYWIFERFKYNEYNNVGFILKNKRIKQGKQFIQFMCGPRK
jgi:hypothetical protein